MRCEDKNSNINRKIHRGKASLESQVYNTINIVCCLLTIIVDIYLYLSVCVCVCTPALRNLTFTGSCNMFLLFSLVCFRSVLICGTKPNSYNSNVKYQRVKREHKPQFHQVILALWKHETKRTSCHLYTAVWQMTSLKSHIVIHFPILDIFSNNNNKNKVVRLNKVICFCSKHVFLYFM